MLFVLLLFTLTITGCSPAPTEEDFVGKWHGTHEVVEEDLTMSFSFSVEFKSDGTYTQQAKAELLVAGEAAAMELDEVGDWSVTPTTRMMRMTSGPFELKSTAQSPEMKEAMAEMEREVKAEALSTTVYEVIEVSKDRIKLRDIEDPEFGDLVFERE
jgi:hypothetical protein